MNDPLGEEEDVGALTSVRQEFSGPIPHPAILEQYDRVVAGAAERILKMAEHQAAHRMELERMVIASDIRKSERGQYFGLTVALGGLLAALILGLTGHETAAAIVAGSDLVSLAGVFVFGRIKKSKEREQARQEAR